MKIYITTGTFEYLKKIEEKHSNEKMITMMNSDSALLLHETNGETVFKAPRRYEVLHSIGEIKNAKLVVLNHIQITDEEHPLFEYQCKNKTKLIEKEHGFVAFRFLRPLTSRTYIILSAWDKEGDYKHWQNSQSMTLSNDEKKSTQEKILVHTSYLTKYFLPE